jgi:hypothetical protein
MKKTIKITGVLFAILACFTFIIFGCNEAGDPSNKGGGSGTPGVPVTLMTGNENPYELTGDSTWIGAEIDLTALPDYDKLVDISEYESVTVDATLCSDGNKLDGPQEDGLAQFKLLYKSGGANWTNEDNIIITCYNLKIEGSNTSGEIDSAKKGKPTTLLVEGNKDDSGIDGIIVRSITFNPRTLALKESDVVYSWGSGSDQIAMDQGTSKWPGGSIELDAAPTKKGTIGNITNYKEIIVDAQVLDRDGKEIPSTTKLIDDAFFILVSDNSSWSGNSELVKQYNMKFDGRTSVTPETTKTENSSGEPEWRSGTPTWIAFCAERDTSKPNSQQAGYVVLRNIYFITKE